jgi:alkylhydroperoxidase family enzyme
MIADEALLKGVLTRGEQQAVLLELARYLNSRYDAVIHARMALDAGLPAETVGRLLDGSSVRDNRLNALVQAARLSCEKRAWLSPKELGNLKKQGVTRGDLYEIFALVGMKKMTAFTHHMSDFPVEAPLKPIDEQLGGRFQKPDSIKRQRLFTG